MMFHPGITVQCDWAAVEPQEGYGESICSSLCASTFCKSLCASTFPFCRLSCFCLSIAPVVTFICTKADEQNDRWISLKFNWLSAILFWLSVQLIFLAFFFTNVNKSQYKQTNLNHNYPDKTTLIWPQVHINNCLCLSYELHTQAQIILQEQLTLAVPFVQWDPSLLHRLL